MATLIAIPALAAANVQALWSDEAPLAGYRFGDFDGDGRTDVFRISGAQWQFSSAGAGPWQNLAVLDATPIDNLRFGDFNGDNVTDVFSLIAVGGTNQWRWSRSGRDPWQNLAGDPLPLQDLRFGDFNGDNRTDVFSLVSIGGTNQWRYSSGGITAWQNLATDPLPLQDLRFGDFNGDNVTDVFSSISIGGTNQWRYSPGGNASWQNLATDPLPLQDLRFGDFDRDGRTDVFSLIPVGGTYQWRYSSGGIASWQNLASDPTSLADLRFGDFNGDRWTDVFSISGGQFRYSPSGVGGWIYLTPAPSPSPLPPSGPVADLRFGDFDGDNRTDVFRITGNQWQVSSAGLGPWQNLATDPLPLGELRFSDPYGDARDNFKANPFADRRTDIFSLIPAGGGNQWRFSAGGAANWQNLATDPTPLQELRFGDFDGDGITDLFSLVPSGGTNQWRWSRSGRDPWQNLAGDPLPLQDLRFGDFNGDNRTDVFSLVSIGGANQWRYSSGGLAAWQNLAADPLPLQDLRFGDFNGDGRTDVFSLVPSGGTNQWRWSRSGTDPWQNLASDPLPLQDLRFGDFNGDGRTDIFSVAPDGRWRYSSAGESSWTWLGPPTITVTPYPTVWPTVTATPVPPPQPGCANIAVNSNMELEGGWIFGQSPIPGKYVGLQVHSGQRAIQLGNSPDSGFEPKVSYSSIRQPVTIPANASSAQLRWWHYFQTEQAVDDNANNRSARQEVILLTPHGKTLRILQRVRRNDGVWKEEVRDLTEYVGQSFYIYFNVFTDNSPARTWMYLDDIVVDVCYPPPTPTPIPSPTPTPSNTPTATPTPTVTETPTVTPTPTDTPEADALSQPSASALSLPSQPSLSAPSIPANAVPALVTAVLDGETIEVILNASSASPSAPLASVVRYSLVALDRRAVQADKTVALVHYADIAAASMETEQGLLAAEANRSLVEGAIVYLEIAEKEADASDAAIDAYVFLTDGTLVNAVLIAAGYAVIAPSAPDGPYEDFLRQAQTQAQAAGAGMWGASPLEAAGHSPSAVITATVPVTSAAQISAAETPVPTATQPATAVSASEAPVFTPANCVELVNNGGFEATGAGWNLVPSEHTPVYAADFAFGGSAQALRLGNIDQENLAGISAADQTVYLPEDASSIVLSFRYYPLTDAEPGPGDFQYVDIYNVMTGQFAGRALGVQQSDARWLAETHDLTSLAGQPVRIVFAVNNDGVAGRTAMVVDNVSILACASANDAAPNREGGDTPAVPDANATVTPADAADPSNSDLSPEELQTSLASRETDASSAGGQKWLGWLFTSAVMLGVLGMIGFGVLVIKNTLRPPGAP